MNLLSKQACYIYISLWILYGLQKILMLQGIMAQVIFVVLMMMSFYACYMVNRYWSIYQMAEYPACNADDLWADSNYWRLFFS